MTYYSYVTALVNLFAPVTEDPEGLESTLFAGVRPISVAQAVAVAQQVLPDAPLTAVVTPDGPTGVYNIKLRRPGEVYNRNEASTVWIDQYSGKVLAYRDRSQSTAADTFLALLPSLHNGEALGLPGRITVCITGFMPLVLYVTGVMRWLQKRRPAKQPKTRFEDLGNDRDPVSPGG